MPPGFYYSALLGEEINKTKVFELHRALAVRTLTGIFIRQINDESRPLSRLAAGGDASAMAFDYFLADGEAHSGSFILTSVMKSLKW